MFEYAFELLHFAVERRSLRQHLYFHRRPQLQLPTAVPKYREQRSCMVTTMQTYLLKDSLYV